MLCWGIVIATDGPDGLQPCPTEDSVNCYWDADTMGNGLGNDFVTLGGE
jgi:hypothetical protein